jgi:beta-galactosidase
MNTIAIRVDAGSEEAGGTKAQACTAIAGWSNEPVHVVTDGVHATAPGQDKQWSIPVEVTLNNSGKQAGDVIVEVTVRPVRQAGGAHRAGPRRRAGHSTVQVPVAINDPALWSIEKTNLYRVTTRVLQPVKRCR